METRHIRFDYDKVLSSKKALLNLELNLLSISRKLNNYQSLRKKESVLKNKLKICLISLKTKISIIQSFFPKEQKSIKQEIQEKKQEINENQDIQNQLKEIQDKLAGLS